MDDTILFIGFLVIVVGAVIVWKWMHDETPIGMPAGWQFYEYPTNGSPPGSIIRIKNKTDYDVTTLKVNIKPEKESMPKRKRKIETNMGMLMNILGLAGKIKVSINSSAKKDIIFEMEDPENETTYDDDIDPEIKDYFHKNDFKKDYRYFIIRETKRTKKIIYTIKRDIIDDIGGEVEIKKKLDANANIIKNKEGTIFDLSNEFDEPMRIMFKPEEIQKEEATIEEKIIKEAYSKDKAGEFYMEASRYSRKAVTEPLEWTKTDEI